MKQVDSGKWKVKNMKKEKLSKALEVVNEVLVTDESYFIAWQANIAMAFKDNAAWFKKSNYGKRNVSNSDIHRIANRAADYFIEQLTGVKIEDMEWNKPKPKRKLK